MKAVELRAVLLAVATWVGATLVTVADDPLADDAAPPTFRNTTEYYVLKTAYGFGVGGWRTFAFRRVLERPDADAVFKDLLEHASLAGQLYALCGLWFTDPVEFRRQLEYYQKIETELTHTDYGGIAGCGNTSSPSVREWVLRDAPDAIRLTGPEDSIAAWRQRTGRVDRYAHRDISGGAWPYLIGGRSPNGSLTEPEEIAFETAVESALEVLRVGKVPWVEMPPTGLRDEGQYEIVAAYRVALVRHGAPLPAAVLAALRSERPRVRQTTLLALLSCGPAAAEAADQVAEALNDPDREVRSAAQRALSCIGPWAGKAWPVLWRHLEKIGPSDEIIVSAGGLQIRTRDGDEALGEVVRSMVVRATPAELPHVRRLLAHPHPRLRAFATRALHFRPYLTGALVPELGRALEDPVDEVRLMASRALGRVAASTDVDHESTRDVLVKTFTDDPNETVRVTAALGLGKLGSDGLAALPTLTAALDDPSPALRIAAAFARWEIGRTGPEAVPTLLTHLESAQRHRGLSRTRSATILAELAADRDVAETLSEWLLEDPPESGRTGLLRALGRTQSRRRTDDGRQQLIPTLRELALRDDLMVALPAADALYHFTGNAQLAVKHWIAQYSISVEAFDGRNATKALRQLKRFGAQAQPAARLAETVLLGDSAGSRLGLHDESLRLLASIGPGAGTTAAEAMRVFGRKPRASKLTQLLAHAAGAIGAPAQDLLPFLVELLHHGTWAVRQASLTAIEQIVAALDDEESQE